MCGIVGFAGKERAVPYLLNCLTRLEYRGYDSAGIALSGQRGIEVTKRKGKLSVLTSELMSKKQSQSQCGIGHTRWATHGAPEEKNAHPHLSSNGYFAVVHNGIIENYEALKRELVSQGCKFSSDTDTEVIAHLLERSYCGDFLSAAKYTLSRLEGSYAVAVLCKDYPGKIFCSRWGSPIVIAKTDKGNFISSDVTSLMEYTDEVVKLGGGESALVDSEGIEFFDKDMKSIERSPEKIQWSVEDAGKKGYEHFMLKEIFEQKDTVSGLVGEYVRGGETSFPDIKFSDKELFEFERLIFIGCGSAYHAGLAAKYFTRGITGIPCEAETASEWRYGNVPVNEKCLCVFISQSGETADTLAALRKARDGGARTLGVVNVVSSSVADESESVLYTRAGPEIAVATTKAYTAQLVTLYLFALRLAKLRGRISSAQQERLIGELLRAPDKIGGLLKTLPEKMKALSREYYTSEQMYFIGRNTDCAAAMEGALKLKEISYIPCQAYAAGELKHGTISLIEKGTPVVALMGNSELFAKTLSNVKEVKSRGARVIALCSEENYGKSTDFCDSLIPLPEGGEFMSCLFEGIALQLFAYYTARHLGCDIDKPRNLAKSVTVE